MYSLIDMVGKSRNNESIRQKLQYSSFAKICGKHFGKFLFMKLNLGKIWEKQVTSLLKT